MLDQRHIRAGRALIGATQEEMSRAAKLSLATLNNIEREVAKPRQKTYDKIRQALFDGGVRIEVNNMSEQISFDSRGFLKEEPGAPIRATFSRLLQKNSLMRVKRGILFSIAGDYHRCGLYLEGRFRQLLYISPGIDPRHRVGLADLSAISITAHKELRQQFCFADQVLNLADYDGKNDLFDAIRTTSTGHEFADFLKLFPEAQATIASVRESAQHPLYHVLKVL